MKKLFVLAAILVACFEGQAKPTTITVKVGPKARIYLWIFDDLMMKTNVLHRGNTDSSGYFSYTMDIDEIKVGRIFQIPVYFFPGDSITVTLGSQYNFESKLFGAGLNFLRAIEDRYTLQVGYRHYSYPGSQYFEAYKNAIADNYAARKHFLDSFNLKHNLDKRLYRLFSKELQHRYLLEYYSALTSSKVKLDSIPAVYIREADSLQKAYNDDEMLYSRIYTIGALYVIKYLCKVQKIDSAAGIPAQFKVARSGLKGKTRDYIMMNLLGKYDGSDLNDFVNCYDFFIANCTNPKYVEYVKESFVYGNRYKNILLEDSVSNFRVGTSDGDTIKISQLLSRYKGKVVLLDFWASWCVPCIKEIPSSHKLAEGLKNKDIVFVYVSLDTDSAKWKTSRNTHKVTENSFLVKQGFESMLAKELKIATIPRYVVLNARGQIVEPNAPRPSDKALKELLVKYASETSVSDR